METTTGFNTAVWPLALFAATAMLVPVAMLLVSAFLGERSRHRDSPEPYESGIVSTGSARIRFNAQFYLMAMLFVIFDLEAVFVYSYAVAFYELGWAGYVEIVIFIGVLGAALFYLWRIGALDWSTLRQRVAAGRLKAPGGKS